MDWLLAGWTSMPEREKAATVATVIWILYGVCLCGSASKFDPL